MRHILKKLFRPLKTNEYTIPEVIMGKIPDTSLTPDLFRLEKYPSHLLFVCDDLYKHDLLKDTKNLEMSAFTKDKFWMFKHSIIKDHAPIITQATHGRGYPIKGWLYQVKPKDFISIDKYKENTVKFMRCKVDVHIPYRYKIDGHIFSETQHHLRAFMYVGIPAYWDNLIDAGLTYEEVKKFTHRNLLDGKYYAYTQHRSIILSEGEDS